MNLERNCYSYGILDIWQGIVGQEKRIKYRNDSNNWNNLKENESLVVLD